MTNEAPPAPQHKKPRGFLFYVAVTLGSLALASFLMASLLVLYVRAKVIFYTGTVATALPQVSMPAADSDAVMKRIETFRSDLEQSKETPELVLSADDINAFIAAKSTADKPFKDMLHVSLEGDKLGGQVSLPLDKTKLPLPSGRHLNGTGTLNVSMENGVLLITADTVTLNGKPLPDRLMAALRNENMARDAYRRPKTAEMLRKIESIKIKDGRIAIKPRVNR